MSNIYYQYFTMRFRPQQKNTNLPLSYDESESDFLEKSITNFHAQKRKVGAESAFLIRCSFGSHRKGERFLSKEKAHRTSYPMG